MRIVFAPEDAERMRRDKGPPPLPFAYRQSMRGWSFVLTVIAFATMAVFFLRIESGFMALLAASISAFFGYFVWHGGVYEYRIDATGLSVSPRRPPDRFVPASDILRVQPYALQVRGSRVWFYRVHVADGAAIDLPVGWRRRRRRTAAAFRAIGVEVEAE